VQVPPGIVGGADLILGTSLLLLACKHVHAASGAVGSCQRIEPMLSGIHSWDGGPGWAARTACAGLLCNCDDAGFWSAPACISVV